MCKLLAATLILALSASACWAWTIEDRANDEFPGRTIEFRHGGKLVAELIHGEGQYKPYLNVYDVEERRLTNPGMESDGEFYGRFPHHRGIFIGWNHVRTDLGRDDLWHLRSGEKMKVVSIEKKETTDDSARLEVVIHWLSADRDDEQEGLLLVENRSIEVSRVNDRTRIDHKSKLTAARDLRLDGDLQHAGLHFRADAAVNDVRGDTRYLWAPAELSPGGGRIVSDELQWVNFRFPLHGQWYSVTQLNPPENRATELSWRDYGRFGFFFKDQLNKGDSRNVKGRFWVEKISSAEEDDFVRARAQRDYEAYLGGR